MISSSEVTKIKDEMLGLGGNSQKHLFSFQSGSAVDLVSLTSSATVSSLRDMVVKVSFYF